MTPDSELLLRYARRGDETAFAEVVRRHVNLVYASAVRLLNGDAALAEDVTQTVFTDLAAKAKQLGGHASVAGWLHTSVRYAASSAIRSEQRRRAHEQEASAMSEIMTMNPEIHWAQLRPLIDEAVGQLRDAERNALLLRFFEDKSHREVGQALGLSENAARMKIERGLDKLRGYFARHGVKASAALFAATLGAQAATVPAPPAFAASVASKSLLNLAKLKAAGGLATKAGMQKSVLAKAFALFAGVTAVTAGGLMLLMPPHKPAAQPVTAKLAATPETSTVTKTPAATPAVANASPILAVPVVVVSTAVPLTTVATAEIATANDAQNPAQTVTSQTSSAEVPNANASTDTAAQNSPATEIQKTTTTRSANIAPELAASLPLPGDGDRRTDIMLLQLPRVAANLAAQPASVFAWDAVGAFAENRAQVARSTNQGGPMRWGFIDNAGKVVIAPKWDAVEPFSGGRAAVAQYVNPQVLKWGFVDPAGQVVSPLQWDAVEPFSNELAAVSQQKQYNVNGTVTGVEKWGFINPSGKIVVPLQFDAIQNWDGSYRMWQGNRLVVQGGWENFDGTSSGVVGPDILQDWNVGAGETYARHTVEDWDDFLSQQRSSTFSAPPSASPAVHTDFVLRGPYDGDFAWSAAQYFNHYHPASRQAFSEGMIGVGISQNGGMKWGFVNASGHLVAQPQWDSVMPFSEGLALVKSSVTKISTPTVWTTAKIATTTTALVETVSPPSVQYGYIDHTGKLVIGLEEGFAGSFSEGLAAHTLTVTHGQEPHRITQILASGYIDQSGAMVITAHGAWEAVGPFSEGLAAVRTPGGLGYIDKTGKLVIAGNWDAALPFSEGLAVVALRTRPNAPYQFGYINTQGKSVFPVKFGTNRGDVTHSAEKGQVIEHLPPPFSGGLALVNLSVAGKDNQAAYLDRTGAIVAGWPLERGHVPMPYVDWAGGFSNGYAAVGLPFAGQKSATNVHQAVLLFGRDVQAPNSDPVVKWGFMDRAGNMLPAPGQ
ncbi:MAG TPA: sigma-70 family RNA polymerase sigma factor [Opitutales bacterium]|nr:sigma-70 family RNA polymerase sigma factor [Opitutales bacterium]